MFQLQNGSDNLSSTSSWIDKTIYAFKVSLIGKQRVMQSNSATQFAKQKAVAFTACTEIDIDYTACETTQILKSKRQR